MLLDNRAVNRTEFSARGFKTGPRGQPGEEFGHPVHPPGRHRRREMMRTGDDVRDDFGFRRIWNRRLEDADDRGRPRAKANGLADDRRVAAERGGPKPIRQDRGARRLRTIVTGPEKSPEHRTKAHHLKVRAVDDPGAHDAWFAEPNQREPNRRELTESRDRPGAGAKILHFGHREVRILRVNPAGTLADVNEPILFTVGERPQEDAAHHTENRGVRADTERQRDDDREGESFDSTK